MACRLRPASYRERLASLERALDQTRATVSPARAQALAAAGMLAIYQGAYDNAVDYGGEGLELARKLGDPVPGRASADDLGVGGLSRAGSTTQARTTPRGSS